MSGVGYWDTSMDSGGDRERIREICDCDRFVRAAVDKVIYMFWEHGVSEPVARHILNNLRRMGWGPIDGEDASAPLLTR